MTDYWVLIFFNLLFTSAPPVIYGVLEKDVSAETLMRLPELYRNGQKSEVGVWQKCTDRYVAAVTVAQLQCCWVLKTI